MRRAKEPLTLTINRAQSVALLRILSHALKDNVMLPHCNDRASIRCVKTALIEAREVRHG